MPENNGFVGHKRLIAWEKADKLVHLTYKVTLSFPKNELFGITSQLQRAVLSVPLNIVEGYGRNGKKEFARFLSISLGSLAEVGYLLEFAQDLGYINNQDFEKLFALKERTGQLIWKLYKSIK